MKIYPSLLKISLAFTLVVVTANITRSQTGNMSDITQPNPIDMMPPSEPEPSPETPKTEEPTSPNNPYQKSPVGSDSSDGGETTGKVDGEGNTETGSDSSDGGETAGKVDGEGNTETGSDSSDGGETTGKVDGEGNTETGSDSSDGGETTGKVDGEGNTETGSDSSDGGETTGKVDGKGNTETGSDSSDRGETTGKVDGEGNTETGSDSSDGGETTGKVDGEGNTADGSDSSDGGETAGKVDGEGNTETGSDSSDGGETTGKVNGEGNTETGSDSSDGGETAGKVDGEGNTETGSDSSDGGETTGKVDGEGNTADGSDSSDGGETAGKVDGEGNTADGSDSSDGGETADNEDMEENSPVINPTVNPNPGSKPDKPLVQNPDPDNNEPINLVHDETNPPPTSKNPEPTPEGEAPPDPQQDQTTKESDNLAEDPQTTPDQSEPDLQADGKELAEDSPDNTDSSEESETNANAEEKNETDAKSEEEEVAKKEDGTEKKSESAPQQEVNRVAYEAQIQEASTDVAVQLHEEFQVNQLVTSSGVQLYGQIPSVAEISDRLGQLWQQTGKKPAFINVSVQSNQLETFVVLPTFTDRADSNNSVVESSKNSSKIELNGRISNQTEAIRETVDSLSRKEILAIAKRFREEVSNSRSIGKDHYLESAQQLYQLIIKPLEAQLKDNDIDVLVFSMDSGLRLIPIAALHDGEQFLVEKYAVALVPSFGLTDTRYVNIRQSPILAMGASEFENQAPLPTMSLELHNITQNPRQGEVFLNKEFTVNNFIAQNRRSQAFKIIHLGTHAQFKTGDFDNSYIQFSDQKLTIPELRKISDELGWSTNNNAPIELLVLSACQTALGDDESELGFAGLAVQAGVKSALASLWYISDLGTLALMTEFYDNLSNTLVKAEALRATQLNMLKGEVTVKDRELLLSNGESVALPSTFPQGLLTLSDPYFWSAFTLIGNWN